MADPVHILSPSLNKFFLHFPLVEKFLSTIAARLFNSRFSHRCFTLSDLKDIVSPVFPVRQNPKSTVMELNPPDLPYIKADFPFFVHHSEDNTEDLTPIYYGCLPQYNAFLFQKNFPIYGPQLQHLLIATSGLIALHADPKTHPPLGLGDQICWDQILEPYAFPDYFPMDSPTRLQRRACPLPSRHNYWFPRIQYLLQCVRQINLFIQGFETFFLTLRYKGLYQITDDVRLNREVDFLYNPILNRDQALYLTTLYNFLLREHAVLMARPILHIIHMFFSESRHLRLVLKHIVEFIKPPRYLFRIDNDDENNNSSSSSSI